jgi:hypothetical protein
LSSATTRRKASTIYQLHNRAEEEKCFPQSAHSSQSKRKFNQITLDEDRIDAMNGSGKLPQYFSFLSRLDPSERHEIILKHEQTVFVALEGKKSCLKSKMSSSPFICFDVD